MQGACAWACVFFLSIISSYLKSDSIQDGLLYQYVLLDVFDVEGSAKPLQTFGATSVAAMTVSSFASATTRMVASLWTRVLASPADDLRVHRQLNRASWHELITAIMAPSLFLLTILNNVQIHYSEV